jgi:hypothetical protein
MEAERGDWEIRAFAKDQVSASTSSPSALFSAPSFASNKDPTVCWP